MKSPASNPRQQLRNLREQGVSFEDISAQLGINANTLRGWASKDEAVHTKGKVPSFPADQARQALRRYLGTSAEIPEIRARNSRHQVIVGIGDIHGIPHPGMIATIIDEQPDIIVLGGDLIDAGQASNHMPELGDKTPATLREEVATIRAMIEVLLQDTSAYIYVLRGNHEARVFKRAAELLPAYLMEWFQDPMEVLTADLPRIELVNTQWKWHEGNNKTEFGESRYMLPLGDALFSHANFTGANSGDAVKKLMAWTAKWRKTIGLDPSLYVQFHSHGKALLTVDSGHTVLCEPGVAGNPDAEAYKTIYDLKWKPSTVGGIYLEQIDDITQLETVRLLNAKS